MALSKPVVADPTQIYIIDPVSKTKHPRDWSWSVRNLKSLNVKFINISFHLIHFISQKLVLKSQNSQIRIGIGRWNCQKKPPIEFEL